MTLIEMYEAQQARRHRAVWLVVLGGAAMVGAWLTGPVGVFQVVAGTSEGWFLVAVGVVLFVAALFGIVVGVRRLEKGTLPADREIPPVANPRPSVAWGGTGMDPRGWDSLRDPAPGGSGGSQR
jgi:type VI protein secretion system component VasK